MSTSLKPLALMREFVKESPEWSVPIIGATFCVAIGTGLNLTRNPHAGVLGMVAYCLGIPFVLVLLFRLARDVTQPSSAQRPDNRVQLAAWSNWCPRLKDDHEKLHGDLASRLDVLVYEGEFSGLRNLKLNNDDFDFFIADASLLHRNNEFIRREDYRHQPIPVAGSNKKIIEILASPVRKFWQPPFVELGVPLEFGYSELLCRKSYLEEAELLGSTSYSDFQDSLLNGRARVACWDWHVPALAHLLAIMSGADLKRIREYDQKKISTALAPLLRSTEANITILSSLADIDHAISEERFDIILGSGSFALPLGRQSQAWKAVLPREGVYLWLNLAALPDKSNEGNLFYSALGHWLSPQVQREISIQRDYRSLPALSTDIDGELVIATHPIAQVRLRIESDEIPVVLRAIKPHLHSEWEVEWERVRHSIGRLSS